MQRIYIQIILLILTTGSIMSQEIKLADIPFSENGQALDLAFAGGLRAPQFNTIDLNLDGINDLLIFDRDGKIFIPMIRDAAGGLSYEPSYRSKFPKVNSWILLRDFDGDGVKDIFCSPVEVGIPGIEVYKGIVESGELKFELVRFPERDFNILYFPIGSTVTQIYVSVADLPDIRDIDGDGDLDVVAFEPSGSTIYYYRNLALEQGFQTDTLIYELDANCYGGVVESGFSQEVSLSPDPGVCASFLWEPDELFAEIRHSGSTVLSLDVTGDELQELILGDLSYDGLVALTNTGTPEQAHFTEQVTRFPEGDNAADFELFLGGFHEDIDDDGKEELVVAPTDRFGSQTVDHLWVYNINAIDGAPSEFSLTTKNFLTDDMIYPGPFTAPMFMDYNSDGLMDLVIGTGGRSSDGIDINPALKLYENVGTTVAPSYVLVDPDYLSMAAFKTTSRTFAPSIGDIDGDGDFDLIIGDNVGKLYYLENTSNDPKTYNFNTPIYDAFDIKVSAFAIPSIFDYNNDGLGDLIVGEQNFNSVMGERGSLNYFQNIGLIGSPNFNSDEQESPNDALFGRINLKESGFINNYSAPSIVDLGADLLIASGSASGSIFLFETPKSNIEESLSLRSPMYGGILEGEQSILSFADLNDDGFLEIAIGTRRGGLAIYHSDIQVDFESPTTETIAASGIDIIPNPAVDHVLIQLPAPSDKILNVKLYNSAGLLVLVDTSGAVQLDLQDLSEGIYIAEIKTSNNSYSARVVKVK